MKIAEIWWAALGLLLRGRSSRDAHFGDSSSNGAVLKFAAGLMGASRLDAEKPIFVTG